MSVARHHADWLSLLEISGPFVSMPVLMRVFPQGLDPRAPEQARQLRLAYEEWQDNLSGPGKQHGWINQVLTQLLNFPADLIAEGQSLPPGLSAAMPEYGETLRPDLALVGPKGTDAAGKSQLLVSIYPTDQSLDRPVAGKHWKATPATRMMELLHASDVPLGLVTNGEQWMLVFAPRGETTGFTSWYATLWIEEPLTLRAFHSLLSINRFFGVTASETLSALLKESAQDQQEVTNQLGDQVRDAVEVLIQAFDRLDHESGRTLLKGVEEKTLYDAALTIMMRLVFLFSAEERGLLHLGRPIYDNNYAVSTLREQLQEVADRGGEEVLERRFDAWARLLSSFRAVHGGVQHQDLLLPAYGGSLFDPDRYPFLEGRLPGTDWRITNAEPLAINNRVALHLLKSLQMLQVRVPGGGPAEARRISFRALDIEQIGHIYEGLLDHSASRATVTVLGLIGTRKNSTPNITLSDLEKLAEQGEPKLIEELKELTGRGAAALKKAIGTSATEESHKILVACGQNESLANRIIRFAGLLRGDSFDSPVIVLAGGVYVSKGTTRRSTGTHYTPRILTEPIVKYTLEPELYQGPAEGVHKDQWNLKSPQEILDLKVCDMAMGSGAFLVQACRYLSERLVEAWEKLEKAHPGELLITPEGHFSKAQPSERLIPKDSAERLAIARRLIADRCLYGVDINPMAVEMAKLSIWLITVDKTRPFTFLDHAFKCGDSLLGLCRFKQLEKFSLNDTRVTQAIILSNYDELIQAAVQKRRELERLPSNDAAQVAAKVGLNAEAEDLLGRLKFASDVLIGAELTAGNEQLREIARVDAHLRATEYMRKPLEEFRQFARQRLDGRRTFNWPLEFPEVFTSGGFNTIVGNPPYLGGKKITTHYGIPYRDFAIAHIADGTKGHADLCAYFVLRANQLLGLRGKGGFVVTSAIAEADTREVGLDRLLASGVSLFRALTNREWPGSANVIYSAIWFTREGWKGEVVLDNLPVGGITPYLNEKQSISGTPYGLVGIGKLSFLGSYVGSMGFVLSYEEALELIEKDQKNRDVLFPYLTGTDVNASPTHAGSNWIINFFDWPLNREMAPSGYEGPVAEDYPDCFKIVEAHVKPERTRKNPNGDFVLRKPLPQKWWIYGDKRPALYERLKDLKWALAVAKQATKYVAFGVVSGQIVFSHALAIIASDSLGLFSALSSSFHDLWAREYGSYNLELLRYSPSDVFDTFALPLNLIGLESIGKKYLDCRRSIMLKNREGLTDTYNRFHERTEKSEEVKRMRTLHCELDQLVAAEYGWLDIDLAHDYHETKQGVRYTVSQSTRRTILGRLLALNHERYEEEVRAGANIKIAKLGSANGPRRKNDHQGSSAQDALFVSEDSE
jgi:hypothetical protein